jgi:hypothetical protein
VKQSVVDSEYNVRREECEQGIEILKKDKPKIKSLRDVSQAMLVDSKILLSNKVFDRCLYAVQEISLAQQASGYCYDLPLSKKIMMGFFQQLFHANNQPGQGCGDYRAPYAQKFSWTKN